MRCISIKASRGKSNLFDRKSEMLLLKLKPKTNANAKTIVPSDINTLLEGIPITKSKVPK
jgi:hypothetical protein